MEKFVVSARKYRPARFVDVVGQESVTHTLKNALKSGALAHSFLFCGPRGVGKTTCARILAKTINCQNPTADFEACNECDACKAFNNNSSFNVHELDAASNNSVDDIRSLVEQVRFAPQTGKYKIYIIDEVHMLSAAAFNAFLKTLEEPPSYAIFILATTEKHKIIPTILSRCQIFDFNRITVDDAVNYLKGICGKEHITAEEDALHVVAQKADGAMRDALSMFDRLVDHTTNTLTFANVISSLNLLDYDYFFKVTELLMSQDQTGLFLLYDKVVRNGFEGDHFLSGLSEHLRNLMVAKDPKTLNILEAGGELKQRYKIQAEQIPNSLLLNALSLASQCEIGYKTSKNHRLHVELYLLKMCYLATVIKAPTDNGAEVKKNSDSDSIVAPSAAPAKSTTPPVAAATPAATPTVPLPTVEESQVEEPRVPLNKPETKTEPAPEKKPTPATIGSIGKPSMSGFSLKDLQKEEEKPEEVEAGPEIRVDVDPEALKTAWASLIAKLQKESPHIHAAVKDINPIIEDDVVVLALSKMAHDLFAPDKDKFAMFLRNAMSLPAFKMELRIEKQTDNGPRKAFTAKEKWDKMVEKNPNLEDLRNQLGLRLDG